MAALAAAALAIAPAGRAQELTPLPPQPAGVAFPTQEWESAPLPERADEARIARLVEEAFARDDGPFGETRALVVVYGGRIVLERYRDGYGPQTRHVSWSVAKSITQALAGVAVQDGLIDLEAPMGNPRWRDGDPRAAIPWRTWLQMTDGQRYLEIDAPGIVESDAAQKLFGRGRRDVPAFCARKPLIHEPGAHWNYNSCGVVLIADALTRAVAPQADAQARREQTLAWMRARLFDRIGMRAIQPEFDPTGVFYGSALMYAPARDFAKFGLLYLRDGVWAGERILPQGWVDFARTPNGAANADNYGAGWWLSPTSGEGRPYRALIVGGPADAFSAQGHEGQVILVVPSKDLVVVRTGRFGPGRAPWNALGDWLGALVRAFPDSAPPASGEPAPTAR